jgi:nitroreductase/dihydropteridine reductase
MDLIKVLKTRYTAKVYDPSRKLSDETVSQLLASLRYSPSSVNSQPWHFIVADTDAGKERLTKALTGPFSYNAPKVRDASHVVVLCGRDTLDPAYLDTLLAQEEADGRFANPQARETLKQARSGYVGLHEQVGDVAQWAEKQTYIAQGFLLLAAGLLGVDATPMEGFDAAALSEEFDLKRQGLTPVVLVSLGYHADGDFNAKLPKSRLQADVLFSRA